MKGKGKKIVEQEKVAIDGKDKSKCNTIADVLGWDQEVYKTDKLEEYLSYLDTLNLSQIHRHAVETAGVLPNTDRKRMYKMLTDAFTTHWSRRKGICKTVGTSDESKKKLENRETQKKISDILNNY